jgi:ABC-type polysaccharide/polyol phosphate export systems, permease component
MAFHAPSLGRSFPLFYASGLLPFLAYLNLSNRLAGTLRANKQLLFYPRVSFADALIARFVLNGLTELVIAVLAVRLICTVLSAEVLVRWPELALGVAMVLALAAGIGVLNCFLLSVLPVWERAWSVLNKPLFFLSCVVFIYDQIPEPYRDWLWWNPLVHVVGQVRAGLYATYPAAYVSPGYVFGLSGVALMLGLVFLLRYHRDILNT